MSLFTHLPVTLVRCSMYTVRHLAQTRHFFGSFGRLRQLRPLHTPILPHQDACMGMVQVKDIIMAYYGPFQFIKRRSRPANETRGLTWLLFLLNFITFIQDVSKVGHLLTTFAFIWQINKDHTARPLNHQRFTDSWVAKCATYFQWRCTVCLFSVHILISQKFAHEKIVVLTRSKSREWPPLVQIIRKGC